MGGRFCGRGKRVAGRQVVLGPEPIITRALLERDARHAHYISYIVVLRAVLLVSFSKHKVCSIFLSTVLPTYLLIPCRCVLYNLLVEI